MTAAAALSEHQPLRWHRKNGRTHADGFTARIAAELEPDCPFRFAKRYRLSARRAIFALRLRWNLALSPLIADMHCSF
jgi:hypothetical protein